MGKPELNHSSSTRPTAHDALQTIASARRIALVGASANTEKLGHLLLKVLLESGFQGEIYPINTCATGVLGLQAYASLNDVPEEIDVVVLAIPAKYLVDTLWQCVDKKRVGLVVAVTSGFSEAGEAGAKLQKQLSEVLRLAPFRLLGPNCEGFTFPKIRAFVTFSLMMAGASAGSVAIVSQSGAIAGAISKRFTQMGVGIRTVITTGNEADITAVDVLEWLSSDSETRVIVAYLEEIREGTRFVTVTRELIQRKALVIEKTGRGNAASAAVITHTGAVAGDATVIDGVFEQLHIVNVNNFADVVDSAIALLPRKKIGGRSVGVISIAGGLAVEAADLLEAEGFCVPEFGVELQASIETQLPYFASARNPVDLTGVALARPDLFENIIDNVLKDNSIHAVIVIITFSRDKAFAEMLLRVADRTEKPLLVVWTAPTSLSPEPLAVFREAEFPFYDEPIRAVKGLCAIARYSGLLL